MSILERMRGSTDSTPMQIVLILIVVAFVGWYALPQGEKVQVAVEVDGERVLQQEFGQRFYVEKALRGGQLDEASENALVAEVKQKLARELVVKHEAERLGYHASAEEISRRIKADPRFRDTSGTFDVELWRDFLKESGRSKSDVEGDFRAAILRDKLHAAVTLGVTLDEAAIAAAYDEAFSTVDLEVISLKADQAATVLAPSDAERSAWSAANAEAIEQAYEADRAARYELPERLVLRVIRLQADAEDRQEMGDRLRGLKAELEAGADFGTLARKWSEDGSALQGGALGERRVETLATTVREALADVPEGQVSDVVEEFDVVSLYRVDERLPARTVPLDEVRDEIADRLLMAERAGEWARSVAEGWTDVPPVDLLAQAGVSVQELPGLMPAQYPGGFGMPPADLVAAAAEAEPGTVLEPVSAPAGAGQDWWIARLAARNEADREYFDRFRLQRLGEARAVVWEAYVDDLAGRAKIDTGGGEAVQGGLTSWLQGMLNTGGA